jgi:enoyl-CoA hydratase
LAMRMGKDAMHRQMDMPLLDALEYLRAQLAIAMSSDDLREGVEAFFEHREPRWSGR